MLHRPVTRCLPHARQGNALQVAWIALAVLVLCCVLACAGGGYFIFLRTQRNLVRMMITDPQEIRQLANEVVDWELPEEFTPVKGSSIHGIKQIQYQWNPTNQPISPSRWDELDDSTMGIVNFVEFPPSVQGTIASLREYGPVDRMDLHTSESFLKSVYAEYTKSDRTLTIRGQPCKYLLFVGRRWPPAIDESDDPVRGEGPDSQAALTEGTPAAPGAARIHQREPLPAIRTVIGSFPGRGGRVMMTIRMPAAEMTDDQLWNLLQSIR